MFSAEAGAKQSAADKQRSAELFHCQFQILGCALSSSKDVAIEVRIVHLLMEQTKPESHPT